MELALDSTMVDASECSIPCVGGGELPCGGEEAVTVYSLLPTLRRAQRDIGCYVHNATRALDSELYSDPNMTKKNFGDH